VKEQLKKKKPLACINGVKGAISLFLAVLMTPFLTIATILVETGRYNSAVSLMDEVLGVTSTSTLANYDDYLQERWGLLALKQDIDINTVYTEYLGVNSEALGSSLNFTDVTATGTYALDDAQLLQEQLMEYCKLNAPAKLGKEIVSKVMSLTSLMEKLKGLKSLGNVLSLLTKGVGMLDSGITMAQSAETLKETAKELDELKKEYNTNYTAFETAMNDLITNLVDKKSVQDEMGPQGAELETLKNENADYEAEIKQLQEKPNTNAGRIKTLKGYIEANNTRIAEIEKELKPYTDQIKELDKSIKSNRSKAETAKTDYAGTIDKIATALGTFKEHMSKCDEARAAIVKNVAGITADAVTIAVDIEKKRSDLKEKEKDLAALQKSVDEWDGEEDNPTFINGQDMLAARREEVIQLQNEIGELETAQKLADATSKGTGKMASEWTEASKEYDEATLGQVIEGFKALHRKVNGLNVSKVTHKTAKVTKETYKTVSVKGYIKADDIDAYLERQENALKSGSLKALLDGLMAIYNQLMGLSIFFEAQLNSNINLSYYEENLGGLPGGAGAENPVLEIMKNIGNICKSGTALAADLVTLKLVKMLEDMKSILDNIIAMFENLGKVIKNFLTNIAEIFTTPEKWYLTTYNTYNLACRTDYQDSSGSASITTMTGYSVGKESFQPTSGAPTPMIFGEIVALVDTIINNINATGQDIMFSGAELEYLLFGSTSEIANQLYVFAVIYLIRLVSSIPSIMADAEVQSLAASATLGYPVVIALYILLEPLVQTVLLVNGKAQALIPSEVYLSPSGLPKLVTELMWFCKLNEAESKALSDKMVDAVAKSRGDYDFQKEMHQYSSDPQKIKLSLDFSYKDYCLIVTLLTVTEEQQISRLTNLIQMETLCYYNQQKAGFTFDLRKAFTHLYVDADASISQIMPSLIDSSLFSITREHYRGY